MKTILAILAITAAVTFSAQAQFSTQQLFTSGNASIASSGSTNIPANVAVITARKNSNVGIEASFKQSGASTNNVVFNFARSLDGVNYETTPSVVITAPANGTNSVVAVTNVSLGAVGALKLQSISNGSASTTTTNAVVKFSIKPDIK